MTRFTPRFPELEELDPPRWLEGDELHMRDPDRAGVRWYLPDGRPIPGDLLEQVNRLGDIKQQSGNVNHTIIGLEGGHDILVSTVYLGLDHSWPHGDPYPPIIWETMVFYDSDFGGELHQWRYATRNAAMANHRIVVEIICRTMGANVVDEVNQWVD